MSDQKAFNNTVTEMVRHVRQTGHPLYQASKFWQQFNEINSDQLSRNGLENDRPPWSGPVGMLVHYDSQHHV